MSDAGEGSPPPAPEATPPAPEAAPPVTPPATGEVDYKALAAKHEAEASKWQAMARKHEDRAKANAEAASKTKTVEQQLVELQEKFGERDAQDIQRSGKLAKSQVREKLVASGFNPDDLSGLLDLVPPESLLVDGEPNDDAIKKLTASLVKASGKVTPDPDQGAKAGAAPRDMNALLRKAAGR